MKKRYYNVFTLISNDGYVTKDFHNNIAITWNGFRSVATINDEEVEYRTEQGGNYSCILLEQKTGALLITYNGDEIYEQVYAEPYDRVNDMVDVLTCEELFYAAKLDNNNLKPLDV
jgi:hypothetical protein